MTVLANHAVMESGGYSIANSLRLRSSASARLNRTFGSVGTRTIFTYRALVKRGALGSYQRFLSDSTNNSYLRFSTSDALEWNFHNGTSSFTLLTSQLFRDPSAWYDIMVAVDTTQATSTNRVKIYVNGSQITAFSAPTYPNLNDVSQLNNNTAHYISSYSATAEFFDGYLADVYFIDGQALTPSSFGQTDTNGVWVPKAYSGTYGTNGFKLDFSNGSSLTTLGNDASGNGNNWTLTNFSLTAGATYDWMVDTPTNNYATLNPIDPFYFTGTGSGSVSSGNLNASLATSGGGGAGHTSSTATPASGKWYAEFTVQSTNRTSSDDFGIAVVPANYPYSCVSGSGAGGVVYIAGTGSKRTDASGYVAYGSTYTSPDVIGVALDMDSGQVTFYKNNVSQGVALTGLSGSYKFAIQINDTLGRSHQVTANFGQQGFTYTPPTGFRALCTANRPTGGSITTSGTFTGNLSADGPCVWLNGNPETMTINGNAVTWGTHADKIAGGFKVRSSSASYNNTGSNTYSVTVTGKLFGDLARAPNTAKGNP